jgi:hypothetical protein
MMQSNYKGSTRQRTLSEPTEFALISAPYLASGGYGRQADYCCESNCSTLSKPSVQPSR